MVPGITVRLVEDFQADSFRVYIYEKPIGETAVVDPKVYRPDDEGRLHPVDVGTDQFTGMPQPSFHIQRGLLEELLRQFTRSQPTAAADDAIRDARATRDRLLALVEAQAVDHLNSGVAAERVVKGR